MFTPVISQLLLHHIKQSQAACLPHLQPCLYLSPLANEPVHFAKTVWLLTLLALL